MNRTGAVLLDQAQIVDPVNARVWVTDGGLEPESVFEEMRQTLPKVVRRTPRQRYQAMLDRVLPGMLEQYRLTQKAEWPTSIQKVIDEQALLENNPKMALPARSIEDVIEQGRAFIRWHANVGERQQREQDRKKVTLDWSGLY